MIVSHFADCKKNLIITSRLSIIAKIILPQRFCAFSLKATYIKKNVEQSQKERAV